MADGCDVMTVVGSNDNDTMTMISNDISSFARFLTHSFCLEVLLFWKEVEQFKGLFTREEKAALFTKIYDLYCKPGAVWCIRVKHSKSVCAPMPVVSTLEMAAVPLMVPSTSPCPG